MDSSSCHSPVAMVTAPSESCSPYPDSRSTHEAVHHSPCMQKPFFSIIIPAYNLENYIAATLQSVLVQTFQDFEIIIVDDGSSDETVSIIQSFHDPRIHLVSQVNGRRIAGAKRRDEEGHGGLHRFPGRRRLLVSRASGAGSRFFQPSSGDIGLCQPLHEG